MWIDDGRDVALFKHLNVGDCFKWEDGFYMKVNGGNEDSCNAVHLSNTNNCAGMLCNFPLETQVEAVEVQGKVVY